jgi:uncharacterized protein YbbC (DUF1343 family)
MNPWNLGAVVLLATGAARGSPVVRPGLEVLVTDSLHLVAGRRVGLVANQGAIDRAGVSAVDRLLAAGVRLTALFSPEHGFRGSAAPGEVVTSSVDSATGLPIYSLYGPTSAPTDEMLREVDLLLVDLPDVGARYFTYLWTTVQVMKSARRAGLRVVVLDRPDPIGASVQGNVLRPAFRSPVGLLDLPMRHGLTLGELARLANAELEIGADLVVVPAAGWRRRLDAVALGTRFVRPSPNLKSWESLFHYPGTCLFEGTALSVGRGTDAPYEQIGAPWLDTSRVLALVRRAKPAGVRFEGVTFTPVGAADGKHEGVPVSGIRLHLTDRFRYDPPAVAVLLLAAIQRVHPDRIGFVARQFDRLAGDSALRTGLVAGRTPGRLMADWPAQIRRFLARRRPYLLYSM